MRRALITLIPLMCAAHTARASDPSSLARGGGLQVSPVKIELTASLRTTLLAVRNSNAEAARFQANAFTWAQGSKGEIELQPTNDVSFFPSVFEVPAGTTRNIRIGVSGTPGAVERTYRLIVEQLPPFDRETRSNAVKVLTRMSIPIFFTPNGARATPAVDDFRLSRGLLSFALQNRGERYFMARKATVVAHDSTGRVLFRHEEPAWYMLAGGERRYELNLPHKLCQQVDRVIIEADTAVGPVTNTFDVPSDRCAP